MSDTFLIIGGMALVLIPIPLLVFFIQLFRKKKSKKIWGIITVALVLVFAIFETIGIKTMCEHDLTLVSETPASCTESGEKILYCKLCDKTITESIGAIGHKYKEVSHSEEEVLYQCELCGDTKTGDNSTSESKPDTESNDDYYSGEHIDKELPTVDSDIVSVLISTGYTVEHATQIQQILNAERQLRTPHLARLLIRGVQGTIESAFDAQCGKRFDELLVRMEQSVMDAVRQCNTDTNLTPTAQEEVLARDLISLNLSVRPYNRLIAKGCNTIGDVMALSYEDFNNIDNMGAVSRKQVTDALEMLGLDCSHLRVKL